MCILIQPLHFYLRGVTEGFAKGHVVNQWWQERQKSEPGFSDPYTRQPVTLRLQEIDLLRGTGIKMD